MSVEEIIAEMSKLDPDELRVVDAKLHQLLAGDEPSSDHVTWADALLELAGCAEGLPEDLAMNHDHYLHGIPRK